MLQVDSDTSSKKARELVELIFESELTDHAFAKLNFAAFVQGMMFDLSVDASKLLENIDEHNRTVAQ